MTNKPENKVAINTVDPIDLYLEFQTWRGRSAPAVEDDDGYSEESSWPSYAVPSSTTETLKNLHTDYRHGPIKSYTEEEIEEYVRSQNDYASG